VARDLLADFGLTPASLARIDVPQRPAGASLIDTFRAKRNASQVTPDDDDLDDMQRFKLSHGTPGEKAETVADVLENRRMFGGV
jgi:hypothetical protein